jgi:hypothetical protein
MKKYNLLQLSWMELIYERSYSVTQYLLSSSRNSLFSWKPNFIVHSRRPSTPFSFGRSHKPLASSLFAVNDRQDAKLSRGTKLFKEFHVTISTHCSRNVTISKKSPLLDHILSYATPIHFVVVYFFKTDFNFIFLSKFWNLRSYLFLFQTTVLQILSV